ncbi:MAG: DarT ssDNA thymidine ADP-ribosyltransferase family protein [Trichococcus sp.]|uniref:DarT ssDNA thymidine ADP-ribosyltransferase family protein n=1 Tax=Trichococcus sp. TaxID=1985464 RepID=UPI003C43E49F
MSDSVASFGEVLCELRNSKSLVGLNRDKKKVWTSFCFHFTNLNNAVSILQSGMLVSRNKALESGIMENENASTDVINQTDEEWKQYVRLYFRPRTPTQYNNEGFRSKSNLGALQAHCPFPVFFLFDLEGTLQKPNCYFTKNSLAKSGMHELLQTPQQFSELPFSKIYHEGPFESHERDEIVACRHAEIVALDELKLDETLKFIIVRSQSEKNTLLSLLGPTETEKYADKIKVDNKQIMFFSLWTYVSKAELSNDKVMLTFNNGLGDKTFDLKIKMTDLQSGVTKEMVFSDYNCDGIFRGKIGTPLMEYRIEVYLDDNLAFSDFYNAHEENDLPF